MAKKKRNPLKIDTSKIKMRIPIAKPGLDHGDKTKYNRKPKYPKTMED